MNTGRARVVGTEIPKSEVGKVEKHVHIYHKLLCLTSAVDKLEDFVDKVTGSGDPKSDGSEASTPSLKDFLETAGPQITILETRIMEYIKRLDIALFDDKAEGAVFESKSELRLKASRDNSK
jgi:hypothetical protein